VPTDPAAYSRAVPAGLPCTGIWRLRRPAPAGPMSGACTLVRAGCPGLAPVRANRPWITALHPPDSSHWRHISPCHALHAANSAFSRRLCVAIACKSLPDHEISG
jgi:hypothetical protein